MSCIFTEKPVPSVVITIFLTVEPSRAPDGLTVSNSGSTYLNMSWNTLPVADANGVITRYTIYYHQTGNAGSSLSTVTSKTNGGLIDGLYRNTNYTVRVSASTSVGEGPQSVAVTYTTSKSGKLNSF